MKTSKLPTTIKKWIDSHTDMVDEISIEQDGYGEHDGHDWSLWLYLKPPYWNVQHQTHCIHAYRVADFLNEVKGIEIEPVHGGNQQ